MENKVFDFTLNLDWGFLKNVCKIDKFDASRMFNREKRKIETQ